MAAIKNVILIGAGGNLGPSVLAALESSPAKFNISVLSRASSTGTFPSHVTVKKTDYSHDSLVSALKGQDAVVSTIGGAAIDDQKKIVDAAIEAGVKRFIPSEYGCNTGDPKTLELVTVLVPKKGVVDYLKTKESKDFSWTSIVNGPFFEWGLKIGFLGYDLKSHTATIFDDGNRPFSTTNRSTIGRAVASVLTHTSQTANKLLYIDSVTTTQNEILASFEKATGKKWEVKKTTSEEVGKAGTEKVKKGDFSGFGDLILAATYGKQYASDFKSGPGLSNDLLELPKENLDDIVKAVVEGKDI